MGFTHRVGRPVTRAAGHVVWDTDGVDFVRCASGSVRSARALLEE